VIRTVRPQATRCGETPISLTLAGTNTQTCPETVGLAVPVPWYTASTRPEGLGPSCATQLPSAAVGRHIGLSKVVSTVVWRGQDNDGLSRERRRLGSEPAAHGSPTAVPPPRPAGRSQPPSSRLFAQAAGPER